MKGTETEKNEQADIIARSIVDECVWINVHILPHSEYIIEVINYTIIIINMINLYNSVEMKRDMV